MWRKQWKNGRSFLLWGRFLTQNLARANPNLFTLDSFNFRVWINICFVISKRNTEEKSKGCALRTITDTQYFYFLEIYFRRHICLVLFNKYMEAKSALRASGTISDTKSAPSESKSFHLRSNFCRLFLYWNPLSGSHEIYSEWEMSFDESPP